MDYTIFGDRVTTAIQFFFQQPPWVMWGGVILATVVAGVVGRLLLRRRAALGTWIKTRSGAVKLLLVSGTGAVLLAMMLSGVRGYQFVEHDKRFCTGCHIFVPSGQQWVKPDTGDYTLVPLLEGKHDSLSCHSCHPLKPLKEGVKMVLWMSGIRDSTIPEHAKVPRKICEQCHVQGEASKTWQAIAATAGHRTHLESDSSALTGKKECLTCHARTAHRFVPVNETCGQSGCHRPEQTRIVLGKMSAQGDFHCAACHVFTATVPALATRDSAAGTLRPALQQCFRCHEMKQRLPDFDAARDPHNGTCGMCHDPHRQKSPSEARTSCASANCHADWRKDLFHTGAQHRRVGERCLTCHIPHAARVDPSDCTGCHERVRARRTTGPLPPLPFDTSKALRSSRSPPEPVERPQKVKGDAPPAREQPAPPPPPEISLERADSFEHPLHQKLACLTCHVPSARKSKLTFEPPRGCQICHHQDPKHSECATCHTQERMAPLQPVSVSVTVRGHPPRDRTVGFPHGSHRNQTCATCHTTPVTLAPPDSVIRCQGCHESHHEAGRTCATCHRTEAITAPHARPALAHTRCDACHTRERIAALEPGRSFCLTCHAAAQDHHAPIECTTCHFLSTPADYRPQLLGSGGGQ